MCMNYACCRGSYTFACLSCGTTAKGTYKNANNFCSTLPNASNKTTHPNCPKCREPMLSVGNGPVVPKKVKFKKLVKSIQARVMRNSPKEPDYKPTPKKVLNK